MDRKLIDAAKLIASLEDDIKKIAQESEYDKGFVAALAQMRMVLRLMPEESEAENNG